MKSTGAGFPAAAAESITQSLSEICAAGEDYPWDPPRRFSGYANRLHLLLTQLLRSSPPQDLFAPAVHTAFRGIAADLSKAAETVGVYRSKSRIYVLINCTPLCSSLHDRTISIGGWLALLLDSPLPLSNPGLHKKAADLSRDMKQANLRVTENEERVYRMLKKEGEARQTSKAVQSGIIMDLARALGMGPTDHDRLAEQIRLLKLDLAGSSSVTERRILISLEKIFDSWSAEPHVGSWCSEAGFEEEAHIPLFKNFLCPLTKEVMKDPVALESLQTYERTAIRYWFDRCIEDGRDPTCPVTGQVLKTLELKPNIGLAGAIEEWVNRNIETQINSAVQYLCDSCSSPLECVERALDNVYRMLEEYPSSKYRVRNAGIVGLVVKLLKDQCNSIASHVRGKALMALHSMARDEESKLKMMDEGITRLAIRSLTGSLETEREYAVKLLLGFSCDEGYCAKLASEKGAVVLLSSMAGSSENPTLSNLAEELLRNMEKVEENVQHLAVAGRFQPLLTRLCEGTEDTRIEIACLVGQMTLANNGKEHIARQGGKVLVAMLSSNLEGRTSSLQALYNLSTWDDNATILVDYGVLPALTNILFTQEPNDPYYVMELATSTMANMVSKSGHWELSAADKDGHSMQSDFIIHRLLELISLASSKCQVAILQILYGITSSPQASELAATHIRSCNGVGTITTFLEHPEIDHRIYAFRLANLLSERLGQDLADELRASNKLSLLVHKLMDTECSVGERSEVAGILANLPFSAEEVRTVLGTDLLKWAVSNLKEQRSRTSGRHSRHYTSLVEGLLGLLLHYARTLDPTILRVVRENQLMTVFQEQLTVRSQAREKQRAVLGLKYLSESAKSPMVSGDLEPQPPRGFCAPLVLMCGRAPMIPVLCPLHSAACEEDSSFCLLKGNAVKPLIDLMNDENTGVQIAAVEALSTLVLDVQSLKIATKELEQLGLIDATIDLFKGVRPGELQERVIWMVDKFFQVDSLVQVYSVDQGLVRALVEALKHGNTNTKRHARDALTYLRELSGVGGKNPNQSHGRRVIS